MPFRNTSLAWTTDRLSKDWGRMERHIVHKGKNRKQNSRKQEQSGKLNLFSAQEEILSSKCQFENREVSSIYEWLIYILKKLNKMTKKLRAKCQGVCYTSEKDSINSCIQEFKIRQKLIRIMNRYITIW